LEFRTYGEIRLHITFEILWPDALAPHLTGLAG
jgi:hypothetical protein